MLRSFGRQRQLRAMRTSTRWLSASAHKRGEQVRA
jgi:hypothetical protein